MKWIWFLIFIPQALWAQSQLLSPCSNPQNQKQVQILQALLQEEGPSRHVGYFELRKANQVVGFLPTYKSNNTYHVAHLILCTDFPHRNLMASGVATDLRNWLQAPKRKAVQFDGLLATQNSTSRLRIQASQNDLIIDLLVRSITNHSSLRDRVELIPVLKTL